MDKHFYNLKASRADGSPAADSNVFIYSVVKHLDEPIRSDGFSIKYVINDGKEIYHIDSTEYVIGKGEYLLTNQFRGGDAVVDSDHEVDGICIDISPEMLMEVVSVLQQPGEIQPEYKLSSFLNTTSFFDYKYKAAATNVGRYVEQLGKQLRKDKLHDVTFTREMFFTLSELIVLDQEKIYRQISSLKSVKLSTRKDLLRRLMTGKDFIDDMFTEKIDIGSIASEAVLSQYHFFRLFKQAFGTTPYQYLLRKRLDYGKQLLATNNYSVSDAAREAGFADIFSFSKAFKKHFNVSPSSLNCKA